MAFTGLDVTLEESILLLCAIVIGGVIWSCIFLWCCHWCDGRAQRRLGWDQGMRLNELESHETKDEMKNQPLLNSPSAPARRKPSVPIQPRVLRQLEEVTSGQTAGMIRYPEAVHLTSSNLSAQGVSSSFMKSRSFPSPVESGTSVVFHSFDSQYGSPKALAILPNLSHASLGTFYSDPEEKADILTGMKPMDNSKGLKVERTTLHRLQERHGIVEESSSSMRIHIANEL